MKLTFRFLLFFFILSSPILSIAQNNPRNLILNWKTDTSKHNVSLNELTALMLRDGIPPIDTPIFWGKDKAIENLFLHEPVITVVIGDETRAYPLSILMFHEVVNDQIGNNYFTVTYCPLCNAAIVFNRTLVINGKPTVLDFGVSGMLRNSDMVMWDRQTESWWQQFTGEAIVGKLTGTELPIINSQLLSLEEFLENYPTGKILSTETGHEMKYGQNPYTSYDNLDNTQPRLFKGKVDERLPAMERIININVNNKQKIYPLTIIQNAQVINDVFENKNLVLFYSDKTVSVLDQNNIAQSKKVGSVTVFSPIIKKQKLEFAKEGNYFVDKKTNSKWNITGKCIEGKYKNQQLIPVIHGNHFAFAWFAFNPDCEIYTQ